MDHALWVSKYVIRAPANDDLVFNGESFVVDEAGHMLHARGEFQETRDTLDVIDIEQSETIVVQLRCTCAGALLSRLAMVMKCGSMRPFLSLCSMSSWFLLLI